MAGLWIGPQTLNLTLSDDPIIMISVIEIHTTFTYMQVVMSAINFAPMKEISHI